MTPAVPMRRIVAHHPVRVVLGAAGAGAATVLALLALASPTPALAAGALVMLLFDLTGIAAALLAAHRTRGTEHAAFFALAGVFACWALTRVLWLLALRRGDDLGATAALELVWAIAAALGTAALLLLYVHHRHRPSLSGLIDGAVVAVSLAVVLWRVVFGRDGGTFGDATSAAYLGIGVGGLVVLGGMVAWRRSTGRRWLRWGLIALVPLLADMALGITAEAVGSANLRAVAMAFGVFGPAALIILALSRARVGPTPTGAPEGVGPRSLALRAVPAAALVLALASLTWEQGVMGVLAVVAAVLLVVRLQRALTTVEALLDERSRWAFTDALTGVPNRRRMEDQLPAVAADAQASGVPASVIAIDLDNFKRVNDGHGHAVGDALLREVATAITRVLRARDTLFRVGGDEFVVLLPATRAADAVRIAERVREAVAASALSGRPDDPRVTTSVGVAELPRRADAGDTREAADRALYAAKARGRDRVVAAADLSGPDRAGTPQAASDP